VENTFYCLAIVGVVTIGMTERPIDVSAVVMFFLPEDKTGMEAGVFSLTVLQTEEKLFSIIAESDELIADGLKAIAYCFAAVDGRTVQRDSGTSR
jgi:hypothetical protein